MEEQPPDDPKTHYTVDETRAHFVQRVMGIVEQWDKSDLTSESLQSLNTQRGRLEGVAFSMLSMIDGGSLGMPGFKLIAMEKEDPEEVAEAMEHGIKQHSTHDIAGSLHEVFKSMNQPDHPLANFRKDYDALYAKMLRSPL